MTLFDVPEALKYKHRHCKNRRHKRLKGRSIETRPPIAVEGTEFGHWGAVNGHRIGCEASVLTLAEKKTRNYLAIRVHDKRISSVKLAMENLHYEYGKRFLNVFKAITIDSGSEFENILDTENGER